MNQAQEPEAEARAIQIDVDWSDEPPAVYANNAQITANPRDVSIVFTEFQLIEGRGDVPADHMPKAKVVANVRLSPEALFELAATVGSAWNIYAQRYGDPQVRGPRFELTGADGRQLDGLA